MPEFTLSVNSRRRTAKVPAQMPLLRVLRDTLALTGTKDGCGMSPPRCSSAPRARATPRSMR